RHRLRRSGSVSAAGSTAEAAEGRRAAGAAIIHNARRGTDRQRGLQHGDKLMNRTVGVSVIVAVVALVLIYSSTFFVQQSQNAVVVRFGKLIDTVTNEPGLHWRVPFIDHVFAIDRRIINIDAPAYTVTTKDQKRIIISAYVRYQIFDPETFYRVARTEQGAEGRILAVLNQMLRDEFGSVPMTDMLTEKRAALMSAVTKRLQPQGKQFGINVVDVRFKRLDLPTENSASIY